MSRDSDRMPRDALVRELQTRSEVDSRLDATQECDPSVLIQQLQRHQIEVDMQNRALLEVQHALEQSRGRYADLYDQAPIAIVTLDAHGIIQELNLTGAALLGEVREQLVGCGFNQLVIPSDRGRFAAHLRRCVSTHERVSTELTLRVQERQLSVQVISTGMTERGEGCCPTALIDVTDLKQSALRLRLLSDAGKSLACSLDYRSTIGAVVRLAVPLFADACLLDLAGENDSVERLDIAATDQAVVHALLRAATTHPLRHSLQRAVIASGRATLFERPPEVHGDPEHETAALWEMLDAQTMIVVPISARGHTLGALTFVTSTSGRRFGVSDVPFAEELGRRAAMAIDNARLYEQAQRAVQARENLLAIVSHDLQNPLAAILMRASMLIDGGADAVHCVEDAEAILRAARGMRGLIDDLLDLASMDAGTLSMRLQPWPLGTLVDETLDQLAPLAAQRGIKLARCMPSAAIEVRCDRDRIVQVLSNLLGNALKFTAKGGRITVSARLEAGEVCVSVADTGCGITPEQLPHVFDRYFRADPSQRTGTGLGLSICKAIIDAHHGRIRAESAPGQGATFYFAIPLAPRPSGG